MTTLVIVYFVGLFFALLIGFTTVLVHVGWEGSYIEDYERKMFLAGWRIAIFSWAWPVLAVMGAVSLHRLARRAADTQDQGEQCKK